MGTNNIAENIFDSISLIVEKRIANLAYDKTIICTITDISGASNNIYKVSDGSAQFNAQGDGGIYAVDDQVRVLIIDGDYTKPKFIQGKYSENEDKKPITYVSPFNSVLNITDNLSTTDIIYSITANHEIKEIPIETIDLANVINADIYDTLSIRADFQTNFNGLDIRTGDYGIHIKLNIQNKDDSGVITLDRLDLYFSALRDMIGNPYAHTIYTTQETTYKFSEWPAGNIISAELFLYQDNTFAYFNKRTKALETLTTKSIEATKGEETLLKNIFVKNIYFGFGSQLSAVEDNKLQLYTNDALTFTKSNTSDEVKKTLELLWYNKSEANEYIGFADGIYDPRYDEKTYQSLVFANQRLLQYKSDNSIPHDENCLDLWADVQDIKTYAQTLFTLIGSDLFQTLKGFERYLTGIIWSGDSPFTDLFSGETTSLGYLANKFNPTVATSDITQLVNLYATILGQILTKIQDVEAVDEAQEVEIADETAITTLHNPFGDNSLSGSIVASINASITTLLTNIKTTIDSEYPSFLDTYTSYKNRLTDLLSRINTVATDMYNVWKDENVDKLWTLWNTATYTIEEYKDLLSNKDFVKDNENRYCIYWYRYRKDLTTTDPILQKPHWEHLTNYNNFGLPISSDDDYKIVDEDYYDKRPIFNESDHKKNVTIDLQLQAEDHFQVVLFYNHIQYTSNILTFSNSVDIETLLASAATAFSITHGHKSQEAYQSYNEYGTLVNAADAQITRKLIAHFAGETGGDEYLIGATLYWYIPLNNTMLTVYDNELSGFTLLPDTDSTYYKSGYACYYKTVSKIMETDEETGETVSFNTANPNDLVFPYHIKDYYRSSATQNMILCTTKLGDINYYAEVYFSFTSFGTNGTDYTLALLPNAQFPMATREEPLFIQTHLYNNKNEEIAITDKDIINPELIGASGYDCASKVIDSVLSGYTITKTANSNYAGILKCTMQDVAIEGFANKINLTSYAPIPYAYVNTLYLEGPTSIIYDSLGTNPSYYRHAYKLYTSGHVEVTKVGTESISWQIRYYYDGPAGWTYYTLNEDGKPIDENGKDSFTVGTKLYKGLSVEYVPVLVKQEGSNDVELSVSSMYLSLTEEQQIYPVVIARVDVEEDSDWDGVVWAQPLLILQNQFASPVINQWDGSLKINEDNDIILAPMFGAGRKTENNNFEGILMGDVAVKSEDDSIQAVGLYGYHEGAQSFGFRIDGTGFIGKSGRGRINLNGNTSTIESASYEHGDGMQLDLDDGLLCIQQGGTPYIVLDGQKDGSNPYLTLGKSDVAQLTYDRDGVLNVSIGIPSVDEDGNQITDEDGNQIFEPKPLLYIGSSQYYLQTSNYDLDAVAGVKLDLQTGQLLANSFMIKASDNVLLSNAEDDDYYLRLGVIGTTDTDTTNSIVYDKNGQFIIRAGNAILLNIGSDEHYLQSKNGNVKFDLENELLSATDFTFNAGTSTNIILDTTAATNVDNTNYFYVGTSNDHIKYTNGKQFQIVANGTPIMTIGNNTYELTSGNMLINLSTGQISADAFTLYTESFKLSSSHITAPTEGDLQKWYGNEPTEETPNPKGNIIFNSNNKCAITDGGQFYAEAGKIANWNIGNNYLTAGNLGEDNSFHMYSNLYGIQGTIANYPVSWDNAENSTKIPGWKLGIGNKFGVLSDGSVHCSNITATGGFIGKFLLIDGKLKGEHDALTISSDGITILNDGAKVEIGNFRTFFKDSNTYWRTTGPLYIQGCATHDADKPISSIELLTDEGKATTDITYSININVEDKPSQIKVTLNVTNGTPLYLIAEKIYIQGGYADEKDVLKTNYSATLHTITNKASTGTIKLSTMTYVNYDYWFKISVGDDQHWSKTYYTRHDIGAGVTIQYGSTKTITQTQKNNNIKIVGNIIPKDTDQYSLGNKDNEWTVIYAQTTAIQTSDRNRKNTIETFTDKHALLFDNLRPVSFKYNQNTSDRIHTGFIAQEVRDALTVAMIDTKDFAGYCEWQKDDGTRGYGLRYCEFIPLNTWQIQKLKPRMTEAEERIYKLEQELQELKSKLI